jgi:hypothetical protein
MDDANFKHLADIPDPFADAEVAPQPAPDAGRLAHAHPRSRVRAARSAALLVALLFEAAWLLFIEHRPDLAAASPGRIAVGVAVPFAAAAIAWLAVTRPGALGLGAPSSRLAVLGTVSVAIFVVGTLLASPLGAEGPGFWGRAVRCIAVTSVLAAAPIAVGLWAFRHAFAAAAPWRSGLLGVSAGALAATTMSIACADGNAMHVLIGHGAMLIVGAIVAASVGRLVTRA